MTLCAALLFPGYLISTGGNYTVGNNGGIVPHTDYRICENIGFNTPAAWNNVNSNELDPTKITLLNWNSFKGSKEGWIDNFSILIKEIDLITLQEGYLTDTLTSNLISHQFSWDLASAFSINTVSSGVLTASKASPATLCALWDNEPLFSVPKTSMITEYVVKDRPDKLLVVNVHMINFSFGTKHFSEQLGKIEKIILQHRGPVIMAGDFNTWSKSRFNLLEDLAMNTGLTQTGFNSDYRSRFFGKVVDHIYTRGLQVNQADSYETEFSDHNPMIATFSYPPTRVHSNAETLPAML